MKEKVTEMRAYALDIPSPSTAPMPRAPQRILVSRLAAFGSDFGSDLVVLIFSTVGSTHGVYPDVAFIKAQLRRCSMQGVRARKSSLDQEESELFCLEVRDMHTAGTMGKSALSGPPRSIFGEPYGPAGGMLSTPKQAELSLSRITRTVSVVWYTLILRECPDVTESEPALHHMAVQNTRPRRQP